MVPNQETRIAIPSDLLEEVDSHLQLFGTFASRQELIAHAIVSFLDRAEDNLWFAQ